VVFGRRRVTSACFCLCGHRSVVFRVERACQSFKLVGCSFGSKMQSHLRVSQITRLIRAAHTTVGPG
jgi:hypothetical protein